MKIKRETPTFSANGIIDNKYYSTENATYLFTEEHGNYVPFVDHSSWWFHWYRTDKGNLFKVKHWAGGMGNFELTECTEKELEQFTKVLEIA